MAGGIVALLALSACGGSGGSDVGASEATIPTAADGPEAAADDALARLDRIQVAVQRWAEADTLVEAQAAAEEARNLVTGPETLGSGDLDGDGEAFGMTTTGLLPAEDGAPGLASDLSGCDAVERDVLGGDWASPSERWSVLATAIAEWTPSNNTFPSLPSQPQRVVGWASLTLDVDSLDVAHEYAGHAQLHVDISREALETCR